MTFAAFPQIFKPENASFPQICQKNFKRHIQTQNPGQGCEPDRDFECEPSALAKEPWRRNMDVYRLYLTTSLVMPT